ncbi:undecaprenyldiphospho-muramoylpentapeptide beta-N-acetylglucosaminyltransferase [Clostridium cylindrosporum]|uniref:UDP-N-acetylglucosamine--N-acetylmuramyl-(pentapeptide) pyrophosphoryl-undecaprenol N-acetylglucosamine transferase n=1 Tax=Clostridium cylindrosporum DSM 605 TaxID=1121307 RepID=A0A0J8G0U2_CLOCY|nr:undecaprenyldiphospho-muramoylpentapeptide beta-N-acetylglucosaminyltransferase [Clostridium cylindrosporum]KMT21406.1 UDP-N-acetylglucosamine--N-acetylmuramyl-(pentapeptide) pyrophosphoryl-undecaprenol N-acetylglucosamine transferase MurG [Clostridium cylindrosporum DSM 605]
MRVIVSGGGTGGHIYPGVAIAKKIKDKNKDVEILFIGSKNGLEGDLVPKEGFNIKFIEVEGLNKKVSLKTFSSIKKVFKGYSGASKIIKDFNPDIVIGTGGYVCGPVVLSAALKGIPTIIHEQNAIPGMTNKILSKFVKKIAITFKESAKFFPVKKVIYTGNPIRSQILKADKNISRDKLGFSKDKSLVLAVGGSRGAKNLNNAVLDIIPEIKKHALQLLFITGEAQYDDILKEATKRGYSLGEDVKILPYIYKMENALAACDIIISRAGATILSEVTALSIPAILIPSPYVANNHQELNANALENKGAAIKLREVDLPNGVLGKKLFSLVGNKESLSGMKKASKSMGIIDASDKIYDIVCNLISKK